MALSPHASNMIMMMMIRVVVVVVRVLGDGHDGCCDGGGHGDVGGHGVVCWLLSWWWEKYIQRNCTTWKFSAEFSLSENNPQAFQ